jgi:hypothetical protein
MPDDDSNIVDLSAIIRRRDSDDDRKPSVEESIQLMRAFTRITDPARRKEIIAMVEQVAATSSTGQK